MQTIPALIILQYINVLVLCRLFSCVQSVNIAGAYLVEGEDVDVCGRPERPGLAVVLLHLEVAVLAQAPEVAHALPAHERPRRLRDASANFLHDRQLKSI